MLTLAVTVNKGSSTAYSTWVYDENKSTTQFWLGSANSYAEYSTGGGSGAGYIALNTYWSNAILLNIIDTGFEMKFSNNANVHYAAIGWEKTVPSYGTSEFIGENQMYYILDAGSGSYVSTQITAGTSITPPSGSSAFRGMIAECSNFSSFYVRNYSNGGGYYNGLKNGVSTRIGSTGASQGYTFDISDYDYVYSCYSIFCDGYYQFS